MPRGKSARLLRSWLAAAREPMLAIEPVFSIDEQSHVPRVTKARIISLNDSASRILDFLRPSEPVEWLGRDLVAELEWLEQRLSGGREVLLRTGVQLQHEALQCILKTILDSRPRSFPVPTDGTSSESPRVEVFTSRISEWDEALHLISLREFSVPSSELVSQTHEHLARFAHEVRSPLTSVVLVIQQMRRLLDRIQQRKEPDGHPDDGSRARGLDDLRTLLEIGEIESEKSRLLVQSWLDPAALAKVSQDPTALESIASVDVASEPLLVDFRDLISKSFGSDVEVLDHTMEAPLYTWAHSQVIAFGLKRYATEIFRERQRNGSQWVLSLDADSRVRQIQFRVLLREHLSLQTGQLVPEAGGEGWRELEPDLIGYRMRADDGSILWWSVLQWRALVETWGWRVRFWVHPDFVVPQAEVIVPMF